MPSTYATNSGIELIRNGEQSGTWGTTTNNNLNIVDRLTNGVGTIDLSASGAAHTLTTSDGALSDGQLKHLFYLVQLKHARLQYPQMMGSIFTL